MTHDKTLCCKVCNLTVRFGGNCVLDGVTCGIWESQIVLLRGANGSGKTTFLNVISGYIRPTGGSISLRLDEWVNPARTPPDRLARLGVGRLWQDSRLFSSMTVLDNVLVATPNALGQNPVAAIAAPLAVCRQEKEAHDRARYHLGLVGMADRSHSSCDMLSVGQMKRVALARLLQMEAKLWLLDEPLAGLDASSAGSLIRDLDRLRCDLGKTLLLVEHRYEDVVGIVDRVWILRHGRLTENEAVDV